MKAAVFLVGGDFGGCLPCRYLDTGLLGPGQCPKIEAVPTKDVNGSSRGNPRWQLSCPKMEVTSFRAGAVRLGCTVALGGLLKDAVLWLTVLQQAGASKQCQVSQVGGYPVEGAMAVAATSQDGGIWGSPTLVDVSPWWWGSFSAAIAGTGHQQVVLYLNLSSIQILFV